METMSDKIIDIEGIGPVFAEKLAAAKIATTDDLLQLCSTPNDRKGTSVQTGISVALLLKWANMADLMRIRGVGGQYAALLHAAGVDSIKELRTRNAENLAATMQEVNTVKKLTHGVVSTAMVSAWIDEAKGMEPRLSY
jgi:predicted flap endonuclease-1-like 5' DNA nuclease